MKERSYSPLLGILSIPDRMDRRAFQQLGNKSPTVRQVILGIIALMLIMALPSVSSSYTKNGASLRGANRPDPNRTTWDFKVITDLDTQSKVAEEKKGLWYALLLSGTLSKDPATGKYEIKWGKEDRLTTAHNEAGRGMELSELLNYDGKLYSFDDRTGIVFELSKDPKAIPRYIVMEGDGMTDKGMKHEWATVKDDKMWLGSFGKEFTDKDGNIVNTNNLWVTTIDRMGNKQHIDWADNYNKIRKALGCERPGYVIHEAGAWSDVLQKWVFLPRRVSVLPYDEERDEVMGSNKIVIADDRFNNVMVREVGKITPERGFSTFKFVPGTNDEVILALKSIEEAATGIQATYITVFTIKGEVLMEETLLPKPHKFEGLEFS